MYDQLKHQIMSAEDTDMRDVSQDVVNKITATFPGIPDDYIAFLTEVGWGAIGMCYVIYESPRLAKDFYPSIAPSLQNLIFIGDDMTGRCVGFDTKNWKLVEVLQGGQSSLSKWESFGEFIQSICIHILADEDDDMED